EFLIAMLAIWKAGGAYMPVDPRQPAKRLAQMVRQSGARLVLASAACFASCAAALAAEAAANDPTILPLAGWPVAEGAAGETPRALPTQLAYVLFTSGSTGVPKGVMIEHHSMLNHLQAKVVDLGLTASDRVAQTAAPTFDISIWQFLAVLLVGGSVAI